MSSGIKFESAEGYVIWWPDHPDGRPIWWGDCFEKDGEHYTVDAIVFKSDMGEAACEVSYKKPRGVWMDVSKSRVWTDHLWDDSLSESFKENSDEEQR